MLRTNSDAPTTANGQGAEQTSGDAAEKDDTNGGLAQGPVSTATADSGGVWAPSKSAPLGGGDWFFAELTLPFVLAGVAGDFTSQPSPLDLAAMERDTREWRMRQMDTEPAVSDSMRPLVTAMVAETSTRIRHDMSGKSPRTERFRRNRHLAVQYKKTHLWMMNGGREDKPLEIA